MTPVLEWGRSNPLQTWPDSNSCLYPNSTISVTLCYPLLFPKSKTLLRWDCGAPFSRTASHRLQMISVISQLKEQFCRSLKAVILNLWPYRYFGLQFPPQPRHYQYFLGLVGHLDIQSTVSLSKVLLRIILGDVSFHKPFLE